MKPVIFYVDDEPHNLTVFEESLPSDWKVRTFTNPLEALEKLKEEKVSVIVSDQRMPTISGVKFLELAREISPFSIRIIVTGYSDEDLVVDSVRRAHVFDYIKKPWEYTDLEASIKRGISLFETEEKNRELHQNLIESVKKLECANEDLTTALKREDSLLKELSCWVPPFLRNLNFSDPLNDTPERADLVGIAFDITNSSDLHDVEHGGIPIRKQILRFFAESVIKNGGWRESNSGDSSYGHFGLLKGCGEPISSAIAAALEFKSHVKGLALRSGINLGCGIGLHWMPNCRLDVHQAELQAGLMQLTQKTFDTSSVDVDLLHRIEKIVHTLPGINIVASSSFVEKAQMGREEFQHLGFKDFPGKQGRVELYIIPDNISSQGSSALKSLQEELAKGPQNPSEVTTTKKAA